MFYSHWKGLIIQSCVGWQLSTEHLWVRVSSHSGRGSYHFHFIKACCEKSLISLEFPWCKLVGEGTGGGRPIRSCQELSDDRIQTRGQQRPGQPAVTSLTLAETIHLAERGPPRVERNAPDPRRHTHEDRNVNAQADMFRACINTGTTIYVHAMTVLLRLYACMNLHNTACEGYFK